MFPGFQLSTEVVSTLVLRYMRKDGTLRFGDYVSAILHLSVAFSKLTTRFTYPGFALTLENWVLLLGSARNRDQYKTLSCKTMPGI